MELKDAPASYASVHEDIIYVVYDAHSTDSITYPNYKYIADVYIGGNLIARVKRAQDPTTGYGVFNISQVVRNYVSTSFNSISTALVSQVLGSGEFYVEVIVNFGEEYGYVTYPDILIDFSRKFFNHYNGRLVGDTTALNFSVQNKFASNNNATGSVLLSTTHYLVPYLPTFNGTVSVSVTPTGGGSSFTTDITHNAQELQILNLSPVALNSLHAGTITADTTSYTVTVNGQTYTVNIICESQYQPYMIHFLNQYGGFESKLFTKVSRRKFKVDKKDFGKLNYTVDADGIVNYKNTNGVYNESKSVYSSQYEEKLTLNSDLLTDAEYVWLADLIKSPMVYIQDGAYFFPVVLSETDYEPKKAINDDLTSLTITVDYGYNLNAQYR